MCSFCKKSNHFASVCRNKQWNAHKIKEIQQDEEKHAILLGSINTQDWTVQLTFIELGKKMLFKLDTGAGCNVIRIGEIKDYVYDFKLIPNYMGKVIPCRPVPMKLLNGYKKELKEMESNKIIRKIEEPTDFVNAVVIVASEVYHKQFSRLFEDIPNVEIFVDDLILWGKIKPFTMKYCKSVDASSNGVGAVLLQDGYPIAYASKAFTDTQKAWAQIEKEMNAIVYACEKFHFYIIGKNFDVESDHKPLIPIMKKSLAEILIRLQKMRLRLQHYDITLSYKPGKSLILADYLSRNYLKTDVSDDYDLDCSILLIDLKEKMSLKRYEEFKKETHNDEELKLLKKYIREGWPITNKTLPKILKPYHTFHTDLHIMDGLLFKNNCLVVPKSLQQDMLQKLHYNHIGREKTKIRARESLFWIGMSKDIDNFIKNCNSCIKYSPENQKEPLIQHKVPIKAWQKLGVDIFHLYSNDYLLIVDYFSKYIEVINLQSLTAEEVIKGLKQCFSKFGIPLEILIKS
ncbi:hypothetical protein evm_010863 [Chilo suppressalis]|nr:hypothetical protein evm_010863 [Chilo suppressalis]